MERLMEIIDRAYGLAVQAQQGQIDQELAEELSGECAELLAHVYQDFSAFSDKSTQDPELVEIAKVIRDHDLEALWSLSIDKA